jgi:hypothetical protein
MCKLLALFGVRMIAKTPKQHNTGSNLDNGIYAKADESDTAS